MKIKPISIKLILMNFLEFAVWGAYLTSLGRYLGNIGLGSQIKWFFLPCRASYLSLCLPLWA